MVAWWTGGAWPTRQHVRDLATFQAPFIAYVFIALSTFTTYALAHPTGERVGRECQERDEHVGDERRLERCEIPDQRLRVGE